MLLINDGGTIPVVNGRPPEVMKLEKIVIIMKHSDDEPEFCINPMILAVNASSAGLHPVVILQSKAVPLVRKGFASTIKEPELPLLDDLIESFVQSGGRLLVSDQSLRKRGIPKEELIDEVMVVNTGAIIREIMDAKHVITY